MTIKKLFLVYLLFAMAAVHAQTYSASFIKEQIETLKKDARGPYKDIRWFCKDGSVRDPKDPCPKEIGPGVQHARYKDIVEKIGSKNHIFLGQILAYTDKETLWDESNSNSRLKQYQLGKYLASVDDGWVVRKGQFYRGALQVEDEEEAGKDFYKWLLTNDKNLEEKFFLVRESMKDVPHSGDNNLSQQMRSQSKAISDQESSFMKTRIKIHGQPSKSDIQAVKEYKASHAAKLSASLNKQLDELLVTLNEFYKPVDGSKLLNNDTLLKGTPIGDVVKDYTTKTNFSSPSEVTIESAKLLLHIRKNILSEKRVITRLKLMNISLKLEQYVFRQVQEWNPTNVKELLNKIYYLGMANAGAGYIELWEWNELEPLISPSAKDELSLGELTKILDAARSEVEWSSSMVKAYYQDIVNTYGEFEPLSFSFIDDRVRGSSTLALGKAVSELGAFLTKESKLTNKILDFDNTTTVRGLNPGYAFGELVVVEDNPDAAEVSSNKIYIFQRPPSDLKPVAGIATVEEGNMVSHVQLLARNLGIPNAALSANDLMSLKKFEGKKVFYAVSNKGTVIMKLEDDMSATEKALFEVKAVERKNEKIAVPIDKLRLDLKNVLNLRDVDASASGNISGPKAANLGQLKKVFPDHVVEGLIIPFGIFKHHMDQTMPGQNTSYWGFLTNMFSEAEKMRSAGTKESDVEAFQLGKLEVLRKAIMDMPLRKEFTDELKDGFTKVLGKKMGDIPVFLRSDTNMEDLKEFTGAGLNLTLFNVKDPQKIWDGIKEVWASPYTERSFKWRQKYLLNPENVFPSILLIPGVNVDFSGVMITKGIKSGIDNDLTVAFSRGAGGAVDGQIAETYLVRMDQTYDLIAPSRESEFNYLLDSGGVEKRSATLEERIVTQEHIDKICRMAEEIRAELPKATESGYTGAYDVELGFKDGKIWLFQVRPFVENKKALSSDYLVSITPEINTNKSISLNTTL